MSYVITLLSPEWRASPSVISFTWAVGARPSGPKAALSGDRLAATIEWGRVEWCTTRGVPVWSASPPFPPTCDFESALRIARSAGYASEAPSGMYLDQGTGDGVWQFGLDWQIDRSCHLIPK